MGVFSNGKIYGIKWVVYDQDYIKILEKFEKKIYKEGLNTSLCSLTTSEKTTFISEVVKEYEKLCLKKEENIVLSIYTQYSTTHNFNDKSEYMDWMSSTDKLFIEKILYGGILKI